MNDAILARYLSGECTPEEQIAIRRWLESDSANERELERVRAAFEVASARSAPRFDIEEMRHWIAARASGAHRARRQFADGGRSKWMIPASVAATIVVAAGLFFGMRQWRAPQAVAAEWKQLATGRYQRADVYLSDGTHVLLAPESRLSFISPLADSARDVTLDGHALFEVKHESLRPFRVHTAVGVATDLGTRFDVKQYAGDSVLRVVVAEGRVAVGAGSGKREAASVQLGAGDLVLLGASGVPQLRRGVDVAREIGWATGRVSFDAVPLRDAIRELRRYYDMEFVVADSEMAARRLTASFTNEPPSEVARVIALSLELRYQLRGKTVTFAPRERVR